MVSFDNLAEELTLGCASTAFFLITIFSFSPSLDVSTKTKDVQPYVLMNNWHRKFGFRDKGSVPLAMPLQSYKADQISASINQLSTKNLKLMYSCQAISSELQSYADEKCGNLVSRINGIVNTFVLSKILNRSLEINLPSPCSKERPFCGYLIVNSEISAPIIEARKSDHNEESYVEYDAINNNLMQFHSLVQSLIRRNSYSPNEVRLKSRHNYLSMMLPYLPEGSSQSFRSMFSDSFSKILSTSLHLMKRVDITKKRLFRKENNKLTSFSKRRINRESNKLACIHVEYFKTNTNASYQMHQSSWTFLRNLTRNNTFNWRYIVASNSKQSYFDALQVLPQKHVHYIPISSSQTWISQTSMERDVYVLEILRSCNVLIVPAGSPFGALAALLSPISQKQYIQDWTIQPACVDMYRIASPLVHC